MSASRPLSRRALLAATGGAILGVTALRATDASAAPRRWAPLTRDTFAPRSVWTSGRTHLRLGSHRAVVGPTGRALLGQTAFRATVTRVAGPPLADDTVTLTGPDGRRVTVFLSPTGPTTYELLVNSPKKG